MLSSPTENNAFCTALGCSLSPSLHLSISLSLHLSISPSLFEAFPRDAGPRILQHVVLAYIIRHMLALFRIGMVSHAVQ